MEGGLIKIHTHSISHNYFIFCEKFEEKSTRMIKIKQTMSIDTDVDSSIRYGMFNKYPAMFVIVCAGAVVMYARSHANAIKIINWTKLR